MIFIVSTDALTHQNNVIIGLHHYQYVEVPNQSIKTFEAYSSNNPLNYFLFTNSVKKNLLTQVIKEKVTLKVIRLSTCHFNEISSANVHQAFFYIC